MARSLSKSCLESLGKLDLYAVEPAVHLEEFLKTALMFQTQINYFCFGDSPCTILHSLTIKCRLLTIHSSVLSFTHLIGIISIVLLQGKEHAYPVLWSEEDC